MKAPIAARLEYPSPQADADRILLIMLPGAGMRANEFAAHEMISALQYQAAAVDIVVLELDLGLYLEKNRVADVLHEQAILPALTQGYQRIWLLGISLGGMGALLYASVYSTYIEGLFLLAPFMGTRRTMAALTNAGGFDFALRDVTMTTAEQSVLEWIASYLAKETGANLKLYLGYARQDRFSSGQKLLAGCLPADDVSVQNGDHDWPTWKTLWHDLLSRSPFLKTADDA